MTLVLLHSNPRFISPKISWSERWVLGQGDTASSSTLARVGPLYYVARKYRVAAADSIQ